MTTETREVVERGGDEAEFTLLSSRFLVRVPGSVHGSGSQFVIPGSWFVVPGSWFVVPGSW